MGVITDITKNPTPSPRTTRIAGSISVVMALIAISDSA
jgi:hypothetical protein